MEFDIYVNTTRKLARAALTGSGIPNISPVYQTHLKLNVWFFAEGEAPALLDTASFVVAFKDAAESDALFATQTGVTLAHLTADAETAHALNATFSDTEVESALNALGTKLNAVIAKQNSILTQLEAATLLA